MSSQSAAPGREQLWSAVLAERPRAQRVARARCRSAEDAEDCVQEAMARVAAMSAVDLERVGPLLATVVANLAADGHRHRERAERAEPRLRAAFAFEPSPEERVCDRYEARWLWGRRGALAEQDRAVFELRAGGSTVGETAALLGLSYKAAESSYTRARARMRAIWRATAAILGVLWCRPAREVRTGGAVAALTAVAVLSVALLPAQPGATEPPPPQLVVPSAARPAAPAPTPTAVPSLSAPEPPDALPASRAAPQPAQASQPAQARQPDRATPAPEPVPPQAPVVRTDPLETGVVDGGGAAVQREQQDESLAETVQRCVDNGVVVSPYELDCRE